MIPSSNNLKTINYTQIVDLSHVIDPNIPIWQNDPLVEFEPVAKLEKDGYYLRRFSMGEHSGTHINAPSSFYEDGVGIESYPAQSLVVPAIVIDIRDKAIANFDYALTTADVFDWEQQHHPISPNTVVLLYTGWQEKWGDRRAFLNQDEQGKFHFPGFAAETSLFLVEQRAIAGVGIDTHGVDPGQDETFSTNRLVLKKAGIVLENLTNLDRLSLTGTTLVIGILRLRGGSGTPVSVLAFVP
ncbi:cyclase family protein [Coleofasciculus sp. FACHB-SPT36]|uniref:cyclase family protein n=1 Tax=Cyanophyceae TaxID=3028117 RepID=UPI00168B2191|nr:cyclase family protein [Coleofasciculus sp. FACHB-SPT36]MBD2541810.1 cyclase family protein [Coleofasciculus sp. FACHB-SPT36]